MLMFITMFFTMIIINTYVDIVAGVRVGEILFLDFA
jgi:hypothetical protein